MRKPEAVKTLLAVYDTLDDTTETVVDITVRAITPAACEMLDGFTLRAVEDYVHAGFPKDCAAVLLIEVEGLTEAVEAQAAAITEVCRLHRARGSARRARRPRARPSVEGPQERFRRSRTSLAHVLRAGRRHPAHAPAGNTALHRGSQPQIRFAKSAIFSTPAMAIFIH